MNKPPRRPYENLLPTLFDRLLDNAPQETTESPKSYVSTPDKMKKIIQRDLTFLLNTTNREDEINSEIYPEVASSTLNYGVSPIPGSYVSTKWHDVERVIKEAILKFEPRISPEGLVVSKIEKEHPYGVLPFEIRGFVYMDPYPMEFTVQSMFDLETHYIHIQ